MSVVSKGRTLPYVGSYSSDGRDVYENQSWIIEVDECFWNGTLSGSVEPKFSGGREFGFDIEADGTLSLISKVVDWGMEWKRGPDTMGTRYYEPNLPIPKYVVEKIKAINEARRKGGRAD